MNFNTLKTAVATQFNKMQKQNLFTVDMGDVDLNAVYLSSFPQGSNPTYRERTEHDCSCCKHFIRTTGNVVSVVDGVVTSIWDISVPSEPAYQVVVDALSKAVKEKAIRTIFLSYENHAGTDKNFEQLLDGVKTWEHFYVDIDSKHVKSKDSIGTLQGEFKAAYDVTLRGLNEITVEAVDTVLELISQGSLYRGEEHKNTVQTFSKLQQQFSQAANKELFVLEYVYNNLHSGRIRNTVIGSLLTDLSDGIDLEKAVKSFEQKVAPANYKRPTALVTQKMINAAKATIKELGLTSALERRYATLNDITINNVLFADRTIKKSLGADLFDNIKPTATKQQNLDKVEEVGIEKFLSDILPKATSLEVMVENSHTNNFVSLIAPQHPTSKELFKWNNKFSWSYNGDFADSIKERVKAAGGVVDADLCCRLSWYNYDDLDLYMKEPNGAVICFSNKTSFKTGGSLDVDMNRGGGSSVNGGTRTPVENIFYKDIHNMTEGEYVLYVNNYRKMETTDVGFTVEVDFMGSVATFNYPSAVKDKENVIVTTFKYTHKDGVVVVLDKSLPTSSSVRNVWGIDTNTWTKVESVMLSPNYWDDNATGNKHYFFMLNGCQNQEVARGFYNEFLNSDLDKHRKVLEMVGSKLKAVSSEQQLSGVGFSSTQKNSILCRVKGSFTRTIKIVF